LPDFLADWVSQYLLTTIRTRFDALKWSLALLGMICF